MTLTDFFAKNTLEHTMLVGYYGGSNYGDELLLEVMQNLMRQHGVRDLTITYQRAGQPSAFTSLHHDLGYNVIDIYDKVAVGLHTLKNKNIIIGGGALWGVDMNINTLILSICLLVARLLGKNVYLIGIGYHSSTSRMGRIGAWFAGKAARLVLARDQETYANFRKITKRTELDKDIAWYANDEMFGQYQSEADEIAATLQMKKKTLLVTLRRAGHGRLADEFRRYNRVVESVIASHPTMPVVIAPMENEAPGKDEYALARKWQKKYPHVRILEMPYNPLALMTFLKQYHDKFVLVGPQFHIILTAEIAGVPYLPVVYDNKVSELLKQVGVPRQIRLGDLEESHIQAFVGEGLEA
jgi:polysaccharide pyruvyl transferase WcaK-like protein